MGFDLDLDWEAGMEVVMPKCVLVVDDDANVLKALERVLHNPDVSVLTASSADEAVDHFEDNDIAVTLSDYRMPGTDGIHFLEQIRESSPDTVRILITGTPDVNVAIEAINKADIDRFVPKPWSDNELQAMVRSSIAEYDMRRENHGLQQTIEKQNAELRELNEMLEKKYEAAAAQSLEQRYDLDEASERIRKLTVEFVKSFTNIMQLRHGPLGDHCLSVGAFSKAVAQELSVPEETVMEAETAGLLHDIGKLGLSDKIIRRPSGMLTKQEQAELARHPITGQAICEHAEVLRPVAQIIRSHHERLDGLGYPDKLAGEDIPLSARIIRVCDAYEHLRRGREFSRSAGDFISRMERSAGSEFDPSVLTALKAAIQRHKHASNVPKQARQIAIGQLRDGMVAYEDVTTQRGALLVSRGEVFTDETIARLTHYDHLDPVAQPILVRR